MMHKHTQKIDERTLVMVVLTLFSWKGAQSKNIQNVNDGRVKA
jgi:hypothetical protein